jgi:5-oxoprolinase (ATP-hydrolysing)
MTNMRITDPESLKRRYLVFLRQFALRQGSGGRGKYNGGEGTIRDVEFRIPITASILSERRAFRPYGLKGGGDGESGRNLWIRADGRCINVGGKSSVKVSAGDRFVVQSPGGGAYGPVNKAIDTAHVSLPRATFAPLAGGSIAAMKSLEDQV